MKNDLKSKIGFLKQASAGVSKHKEKNNRSTSKRIDY